MKNTILFIAVLYLGMMTTCAQVQLHNLRTENLENPLGLDVRSPRFSWQLVSDKRNVMQTAYEVRLAADVKELSSGKSLWSTGKINSDQSIWVDYKGPALESGRRYYWQVKVWDNQGKASTWSTPAFFQMGLLRATDWKAQWIVPGFTEDSLRPSPLFRKSFDTNKKIKSAFAYITAHGLYEAKINGKRVGNDFLTPGWTSYNKRLQYQVYDVTDFVKTGNNVIGVTLGNGWYRGYLAWGGKRDHYGSDIALLFQIDITYDDGTTGSIISDPSWKSNTGAIRYSEIYHGETIDARQEKNGWLKTGYDDSQWHTVKTANFSKEVLVATYNEPVRKHETLKPVKIFKTPKGEQVIDFGQNVVGWVVLKVNGKAGDRIVISHAEVLDKEGNFYTDNLRVAKAQDTYFLNGNGEETFEPHFTWHGFRYIRVEGYPGEILPQNFFAVAFYSDMKVAGQFSSSNELINQLQHNIEWGLRGNFLDVPTDCPQRDERLGWTGDAQVFFRTATFLRDVNNFFVKWSKDISADQLPDGRLPHVIPNVLGDWAGSTGWADVTTIIPWNMYVVYGDKRILDDQYASMKAWVDYMDRSSKNDLWNTGSHFGDWLFFSLGDDPDGNSAITNKHLIAQCFEAHSTQLLINAAEVLNKKEDVARYSERLAKIKDAFVKEYLTPNGATMSNTQTSYVLALQFDILPEKLRQQAADRLVANIRQYGNHLTTGFLGTPYLCHVLTRFGYTDVAYQLLLQDTYPSWLYPVKKGATTIWERWDGIKPDGSFQTDGMNSFNHYAYGAIGDWMYRVMAGLDADEIGYKKIRIQPHVGGGFSHASASYMSLYGEIKAAWKIENGKLIVDGKIPANTTATFYIPAPSSQTSAESAKLLENMKDVQVAGVENGFIVVKTGSGTYSFSVPWK